MPPAISALEPLVTPHGRLLLVGAGDGASVDPALAQRLQPLFAESAARGLLHLGAREVGTALPPGLAYFRDFASRFVHALCALPEPDEASVRVPPPADEELAAFARAAPPIIGAEYLTPEALSALWRELSEAFALELAASKKPLAGFLQSCHPAWNLVGRVHFNLAENRKDPEAPFAFLATWTHKLSAQGRAQHLPLGEALREYAGAKNRERLLSLLLPVQRAAAALPWLKELVDEQDIFQPLRWTATEALRFLNDVPALEASGVVVRVPAGWRAKRPPRPVVRATVGAGAPAGLGLQALLDFALEVTVDGAPLTKAELDALLRGTDGLALLRGQWVEVDRQRLGSMLERFGAVERLAASKGLTFAEAARLLAGASPAGEERDPRDAEWSQVVAGDWLSRTLAELRTPGALAKLDPGDALAGTLRPYQQAGLRWLHLLSSLGLGACLADDMGLGKTIQVLSLLLVRAREKAQRRPSLLVAPASLLANWASEQARFAPGLKLFVAHPSVTPAAELKALTPQGLEGFDLVLTTYGTLLRVPVLTQTKWELAILDEAQAIKNPGARQTKAVKGLEARARIALTGTPVENRLGDLWSIFDFLNPGLLGGEKAFTAWTKSLAGKPQGFAPLRELVRPYILRRMKTDRSVIADLPDKTEVKAFCGLSPRQAALYAQAVEELSRQLGAAEGMQRRGLVLSFLTRFKQLCNHPSQWLGDQAWGEEDSGKFARLREIGEVLAARQEKALVFTQFREATGPLAAFLARVFGREGLVLHGGTAVKERQALVRRFQEDETVPFFVLSVKAGGAGLNLTAASHVIHFDRWWNPAVENQATDRAFRIGQKKSVLVHKFVCRGTVEEKIDAMIEAKRKLSKDLLEGGAEVLLTELGDRELLELVRLDLHTATQES